MRLIRCWSRALLFLSATAATAQQIVSVASTSDIGASINGTEPLYLTVYGGNRMSTTRPQISPLTQAASTQFPSTGFMGPAFLPSQFASLEVESSDIVLISCDNSDYSGNINALSFFNAARQRNASAVLLYSRQAAGCNLEDYDQSYPWVFTIQGSDIAIYLIGDVTSTTARSINIVIANSTTTSSTTTSGPNGSTPSTTVAMIVLYSITGIITMLFITIIVTGAIRAHRHPERYGPRTELGTSRQSRAKGLAKAMLDSLPIVKFSGNREEPKTPDHELESGRNASASDSANRDTPGAAAASFDPMSQTAATSNTTQAPSPNSDTIAVAAPHEALGAATLTSNLNSADIQGCSICTEDFELGQDQRVLPCDHRFHPACVDPWLLNVSATCPLCRIDLRPGGDGSQASEGTREGSNSPGTTTDGNETGLPPPLGGVVANGDGNERDRERGSRRSIISSILGVNRPERMTREQILQALRDYRRRDRRQSR